MAEGEGGFETSADMVLGGFREGRGGWNCFLAVGSFNGIGREGGRGDGRGGERKDKRVGRDEFESACVRGRVAVSDL